MLSPPVTRSISRWLAPFCSSVCRVIRKCDFKTFNSSPLPSKWSSVTSRRIADSVLAPAASTTIQVEEFDPAPGGGSWGPAGAGRRLILVPRADIQREEPRAAGDGRLATPNGRMRPAASERSNRDPSKTRALAGAPWKNRFLATQGCRSLNSFIYGSLCECPADACTLSLISAVAAVETLKGGRCPAPLLFSL